MSKPTGTTPRTAGIKTYAIGLVAAWTLVTGGSLIWNYYQQRTEARDMARLEALARFEKDVIFRRWNAGLGGIYAPRTKTTPPNPYLKHVKERDITTPSGRLLTLINPAYMTRQVHEIGLASHGSRGHITSLKPIRPENAADPWERRALQAFEGGKKKKEVVSIVTIDHKPHLRFMRPLTTEKGCLQCHASQGYKLGQVRGGISISIPMEPYLVMAHHQSLHLAWAHLVLWLLGLGGIVFGARRLEWHEREQNRAHAARAKLVTELQEALDQINTLRGIIPICANCKKIRDDDGFWNQVEVYVREHSLAQFSHSMCPDCVTEFYPEYSEDEDAPENTPENAPEDNPKDDPEDDPTAK